MMRCLLEWLVGTQVIADEAQAVIRGKGEG